MRHPHARDALAKWLVLCLAGSGLVALVPRDGLGARAVVRVSAVPAGLTVAHLIVLGFVSVGWALFVVHLRALRTAWFGDRASVGLALGCMVTVAAVPAVLVFGTLALLTSVALAALVLHVALCLRIDRQALSGDSPGAATGSGAGRRTTAAAA